MKRLVFTLNGSSSDFAADFILAQVKPFFPDVEMTVRRFDRFYYWVYFEVDKTKFPELLSKIQGFVSQALAVA